MLGELIVRFIVGGLVVSAFAVLGDLWRPKTFAGIFGAAPSVAMATLGLTFASKGASYVALEGRSMVAGAVALGLYGAVTAYILLTGKSRALMGAGLSLVQWLAVALGLWVVFLR
jgi:hypothetical protein